MTDAPVPAAAAFVAGVVTTVSTVVAVWWVVSRAGTTASAWRAEAGPSPEGDPYGPLERVLGSSVALGVAAVLTVVLTGALVAIVRPGPRWGGSVVSASAQFALTGLLGLVVVRSAHWSAVPTTTRTALVVLALGTALTVVALAGWAWDGWYRRRNALADQ